MEHQSPLSPNQFLPIVIYRYLLKGVSETKNLKSFTYHHSTDLKVSNTLNKHQETAGSWNTIQCNMCETEAKQFSGIPRISEM